VLIDALSAARGMEELKLHVFLTIIYRFMVLVAYQADHPILSGMKEGRGGKENWQRRWRNGRPELHPSLSTQTEEASNIVLYLDRNKSGGFGSNPRS
jgi:hypothetical protein